MAVKKKKAPVLFLTLSALFGSMDVVEATYLAHILVILIPVVSAAPTMSASRRSISASTGL